MTLTQTQAQLPKLTETQDTMRSRRSSSMSTTSTLPHLKRPSSTISTTISPVYGVYPSALPPAPDIPGRINILRPEPTRRTVSHQTAERNWHNDERSFRMKQREHYRYHNAWSKYYYGSVADKEAYGAQMRTILKQQMDDKISQGKIHLKEKVRESQDAVNRDQRDRTHDAQDFNRRFEYLKTFRDDNKKLMEFSWGLQKHNKVTEDRYDKEQLRYNPINWTASLK